MSDETKLKPCPFCGERGVEHRSGSDCSRDHDDIEKIWCPTCHCAWNNNYWREGREFIDSTWNRRRPHPDAVREAVERLSDWLYNSQQAKLGIAMKLGDDIRTILNHLEPHHDE